MEWDSSIAMDRLGAWAYASGRWGRYAKAQAVIMFLSLDITSPPGVATHSLGIDTFLRGES